MAALVKSIEFLSQLRKIPGCPCGAALVWEWWKDSLSAAAREEDELDAPIMQWADLESMAKNRNKRLVELEDSTTHSGIGKQSKSIWDGGKSCSIEHLNEDCNQQCPLHVTWIWRWPLCNGWILQCGELSSCGSSLARGCRMKMMMMMFCRVDTLSFHYLLATVHYLKSPLGCIWVDWVLNHGLFKTWVEVVKQLMIQTWSFWWTLSHPWL